MSDDSPPSPSLTSIRQFLDNPVVEDISASSQAGDSELDILEEVRRKRLARQDRFSRISQNDGLSDSSVSALDLPSTGSNGLFNDIFSTPYIPLTRNEDPTSLHLPYGRAPHLTRTSPTASALSSPNGRIRSINVPLSPTSPFASPDLGPSPSPTPTRMGGMVIQEIPAFRPKPPPSPTPPSPNAGTRNAPPSPRMGRPPSSPGGKPKIRMSPNLMKNLSLKRNQSTASNTSTEVTGATPLTSSVGDTATSATVFGTPKESEKPYEGDVAYKLDNKEAVTEQPLQRLAHDTVSYDSFDNISQPISVDLKSLPPLPPSEDSSEPTPPRQPSALPSSGSPPAVLQRASRASDEAHALSLEGFQSVEDYLDQMSVSSSAASAEKLKASGLPQPVDATEPQDKVDNSNILSGIGRNGEPYELIRHPLSPVSERTERSSIDTFRSKDSSFKQFSREMKSRYLPESSLRNSQTFDYGSDSTPPKSLTGGRSPQSQGIQGGRAGVVSPTMQRRKEMFEHPRSNSMDDLPGRQDSPSTTSASKSASQLIRMFEGDKEGSSFETRQSPKRWGHGRGQSEALPSIRSEWEREGSSTGRNKRIRELSDGASIPERVERPVSMISFESARSADSSFYDFSFFGDVSVLVTDTQDPRAPYWRPARAVLEPGMLRISFLDSHDHTQLSLKDLIDVESIRARRTTENEYDLDDLATANRKSNISLHVFQLRWKGGRRERFATDKAQQRSEWVTKIWNMLKFAPGASVSIASFSTDEGTPKKVTSNPLPSVQELPAMISPGLSQLLNSQISDSRTIPSATSSNMNRFSSQSAASQQFIQASGPNLDKRWRSPVPSMTPTEEMHWQRQTSLENQYRDVLGSVMDDRSDAGLRKEPMDLWAVGDQRKRAASLRAETLSPGGATIPSVPNTPHMNSHQHDSNTYADPTTPRAHQQSLPHLQQQSISAPNSPENWRTANDILGTPPTSVHGSSSKLRRYVLQDPGQPKRRPPSSIMESERSFESSYLSPDLRSPRRKGRGAWSDIERKSTKSDLLPGAQVPSRAVARDLQRLLKAMERQDSVAISRSNRLGDHLNDIQGQLVSIAKRLKGHHESEGGDEPNVADKVDYMLTLCNILLESQHKVSFAVDKTLKGKDSASDTQSGIVDVSSTAAAVDTAVASLPTSLPGPAAATSPVAPSSEPQNESAVYNSLALDRIEGILQTIVSRINEPPAPVIPPPMASPSLETMTLSDNASMFTMDVDFDEDVMRWKKMKGMDTALPDNTVPLRDAVSEAPSLMVTHQDVRVVTPPDLAVQRIQEQRARAQRHLEGQKSPQNIPLDNPEALFRQPGPDTSPVLTATRSLKQERKRQTSDRQYPPVTALPNNLTSRWSEDTPEAQLDPSRRASSVDLLRNSSKRSREPFSISDGVYNQVIEPAPLPRPRSVATSSVELHNVAPVSPSDTRASVAPLTQDALLEAYKAGAAQHTGVLSEIQNALAAHGASADRSATYQKELSVYIGQMHEILANNMKDRSDEFQSLSAAIQTLQQEFRQVKTILNSPPSPATIPIVEVQPTSTDPGPDMLDSATIPPTSPPPEVAPSVLRNKSGQSSRGRLTGPRLPKGPPTVFGARVWGGPKPGDGRSERWGKRAPTKAGSVMDDDGMTIYEDASEGEGMDKMMLESLHQILQEIKDSKDREAAKSIQKEARRREKESQGAEMSALEQKRKEIEEMSRRQQEMIEKEHSASLDLLIQQLREQTEAYGEVARSLAEQAELASQSSQQVPTTPAVNPEELVEQLRAGMEGNVTEVMSGELKKLLDEMNALNEQKRLLQADISSFLDFQSRHGIPRGGPNAPTGPGRPASRMSSRPPPSESGRRMGPGMGPPRGQPPPMQMGGGPRGPRAPMGR
ncbi:hypothetical protein BT69DRAFT_1350474 [Atractiella rhizophila]|nr:hypothetical protein BT69DRAFT_1350474 [Atractiella rhizophila]